MTSFISIEGNVATINGHTSGVKQTCIDGVAVVQLQRARSEDSGFDWNGRKIQEVKISGVLVYDRVDVACLCWFVEKGIKLDLSQSFVSPDALEDLKEGFDLLKKCNVNAVTGSIIPIPIMGGFTGAGRSADARHLSESIGFQVNWS